MHRSSGAVEFLINVCLTISQKTHSVDMGFRFTSISWGARQGLIGKSSAPISMLGDGDIPRMYCMGDVNFTESGTSKNFSDLCISNLNLIISNVALKGHYALCSSFVVS